MKFRFGLVELTALLLLIKFWFGKGGSFTHMLEVNSKSNAMAIGNCSDSRSFQSDGPVSLSRSLWNVLPSAF